METKPKTKKKKKKKTKTKNKIKEKKNQENDRIKIIREGGVEGRETTSTTTMKRIDITIPGRIPCLLRWSEIDSSEGQRQ